MQRASLLTVAVLAAGLAIPAARAAHPAGVPPYIKAAVADKARPTADTERDANRKPAETLAFAGVKPGDWVLEIAPGKGYYTRMLSAVVGPKGEVTSYLVSQPPKADAPPPPIAAVAAEPHYSNVKVHLLRLVDVRPTNSFDVVWTTQNYHDIHNIEGVDVATFNRAVFAALKPGGIFLVLDHSAEVGSGSRDTKTLHRIDEATVKQEVTAAGFELVGESNLLRNKNDPRTAKVFEGSIQGHTDQFLLKFRKPAK
ncbi:MAG: class I SAM-dependent methyltransferase [Proteobacteria bacterium]|nr:class I SAM-dependent methyltransferase [Pseudomonadota bacterium]